MNSWTGYYKKTTLGHLSVAAMDYDEADQKLVEADDAEIQWNETGEIFLDVIELDNEDQAREVKSKERE